MVRLGDKVIFKSRPDKHYSWPLVDYGEYTVINQSFYMRPKDKNEEGMFYAVRDKNGNETSWYNKKDFISKIELRKEKLKLLNDKSK